MTSFLRLIPARRRMLSVCMVLSITVIPYRVVADPNVDCTIPSAVVCEVTDRDGFQRVLVQVESGVGTLDVVDARFPTCQKSTTVSWDPIVPNFDIMITSCAIGGLTAAAGRSSQIHVFAARELAQGNPARVEPITRDSIPFIRKMLSVIDDRPVFGIREADDGSISEILGGCGHASVKCGSIGEPCLVESATEQASCPGTTEPGGPFASPVCSASC